MQVITVEEKGLTADFQTWGVTADYARSFLGKCQKQGEKVALIPVLFNDSMQLTNPQQWFAANAAFWCRAYREAETKCEQTEALASIRAIYYLAGTLGQGNIVVMIHKWWQSVFELHGLVSPNQTTAPKSAANKFH